MPGREMGSQRPDGTTMYNGDRQPDPTQGVIPVDNKKPKT